MFGADALGGFGHGEADDQRAEGMARAGEPTKAALVLKDAAVGYAKDDLDDGSLAALRDVKYDEALSLPRRMLRMSLANVAVAYRA